MIRIIIVDDHTMVREALRAALEQDSDMRVVAEAGDGETALPLVQQFAPDVVVMDVSLPGISGIETTRLLLAKQPDIKVLALSFLMLIGVSLVADGLAFHIPKGYIYFAMAFSVLVEMINLKVRKNADRPVILRKRLTGDINELD